MKAAIDQERPDRLTLEGHLRGVPLSGKSTDAFPSGYALHIGALASAATLLAKVRNAIWAAGAALVSTRIVLLAHWVTDVVVGLVLGAVIERSLRLLTKSLPIERISAAATKPKQNRSTCRGRSPRRPGRRRRLARITVCRASPGQCIIIQITMATTPKEPTTVSATKMRSIGSI